MNVRIFMSILMLSLYTLPVAASETSLLIFGGATVHLATKDKFHVAYSDQVTGGCLPRPARLKDKLEATLSKHGFGIAEDKRAAGNLITINALGYRYSGNTCLVHISAELEYFAATTVPYAGTVSEGNTTFAPLSHKIGATFLTGHKSSMQGRLEKLASNFGEDLFVDISNAKGLIQKHFPQIIEAYERDKNGDLDAQESIEASE